MLRPYKLTSFLLDAASYFLMDAPERVPQTQSDKSRNTLQAYTGRTLRTHGTVFNWGLTRDGIYYLNTALPSKTTLDFFDFASRRITHLYTLNKPTGWGLTVAPDGPSILYVETEFERSSIMLLKNFR